MVTVVALVADRVWRRRSGAVLGGVLLLPGAWLVHLEHIFAPVGVGGMVLLGLGTAVLAATEPPGTRSTASS